ncbi:MAG: PAS domain S-box protein, partial [Desulfobacteraceae bacterium]
MLNLEREITERKWVDERIKHLNLVLRAIRKVDQLIIQEKDTNRLLQGVCDNLIENSIYYNAWIALLDDTGRPLATAEAGLGKAFLPIVEQLKSGKMTDCVKKAQMQSDIVIIQDPFSTCTDCPLAKRYRGRAGVTARLEHDGKMYGLLTVSISGDSAADEEEQSLLKEVAGDIAYALHNIELEKAHKNAEIALNKSEEKYRHLVESTSDWVWSCDVEGRQTFANEAIKNILGYEVQEIRGTLAQDLIHPEDLENIQKWFKTSVEKKKGWRSSIVRWLHKDGTVKFLESTAKPFIDPKGNLVGFIGVDRDVTDRKLAEEKIKEYSENLERMVEERTKELNRALYDTEAARDRTDGILKSVANGLIVTDIYNRVILMNRAAEDLLNVRFSEVVDRPIDFAIQDKTLRDRIKSTLEKKKTDYQFDFELPDEDTKHPRIMRARTSGIKDKAGNHTGIITIIHDVTLEREVDRMKTEFISTAAHELRTPLTSIQGFSEILLARDDINEEERKKFLSYINNQAVSLAMIVNDLLDISRIESGIGISLNKVPCKIGDAISDVVPYFQEHSKEHRFEVVLPKEPVEVHIDKEKMEQVLKNLISNAVKYSP